MCIIVRCLSHLLKILFHRASAAVKSQVTIESQFIEAQTALEEETKQKLALSSKLRQLEADKEALRDQLEEEEEAKRNFEKQMSSLTQQLIDAKKKAEDEAEQASILEESKKKLAKDLEALQRQVEELAAANDKLEKSKKKIAAELEDANIDLETQRSKVILIFLPSFLRHLYLNLNLAVV